MKKITTILLILITGVACVKKEKDAINQDFYTEKSTPKTYNTKPNSSIHYTGFRPSPITTTDVKGVRMTVNVEKRLGTAGDNYKSVWCGAWFPNGYWTQEGYGSFGDPFSIYRYGALVAIPLKWVYKDPVAPLYKYGTRQSFHIRNVPGTTLWRVGRDDYDIYEFDLGVDYITQTELFIEENSPKPTRWPTLDFNPALEVLKNGVWQPVENGFTARLATGMAGMLQDSSLIFNQVKMGSGVINTGEYLKQLF